MKKIPIKLATIIAILALTFGLGALSSNVVTQLADECMYRSGRAANWADMLAQWPTAAAYCTGMSDGHYMAAQLLYKGPTAITTSPEYWQGMAEALNMDAVLIAETNTVELTK